LYPHRKRRYARSVGKQSSRRRRFLDKSYTILLVPDRDAKVKKIRLEHRMLVRVGVCFGVVVLALVGALAHYFKSSARSQKMS